MVTRVTRRKTSRRHDARRQRGGGAAHVLQIAEEIATFGCPDGRALTWHVEKGGRGNAHGDNRDVKLDEAAR